MIDPGFLDELDRFHASLSHRAHARRHGERESPAVGEGLTFSDYRRYSPGDEPSMVDWKLYARTEELYVKQFEEERQATVHVLLDASRSMDYGEGSTNKFEYGAKLGLGFAYLTAREHDEFRFSTFGDGLERLDAGRSTRGEVLHLVDRINEFEPADEADLAGVLDAYAGTIHSKALILVVGDFLADQATLSAGLEAIADNDVLLAHVVAPEERDPPASGDTVFEDAESDASLRTYFGRRVANRYRDRFETHVDDVAEVGESVGARRELVDTGEDFFDNFADLWFE